MKAETGEVIRRLAVAVAALLPILGATSVEAPAVVAKVPELSREINTFTVAMLRQYAAQKDAGPNAVLSPQSAYHGLAMSYVASGGKTRQELADACRFPLADDAGFMKQLAALRQDLVKPADAKLEVHLANGVWLDRTYATYQPAYLDKLTKSFQAELFGVQFREGAKSAAEINKWIAQQTNNHIKDVVTPHDFPSLSSPGWIVEPALLTVNAVYFQSEWGSRFEAEGTFDHSFRVAASRTVQVPLMHQESMLPYAENPDFQFLDIPYIGKHYSMLVLLPKRDLAIRQQLALLSPALLADFRQKAHVCAVDVLLPKFSLRTSCDVKDVLARMGVRTAFDRYQADFDAMIVKKFEAYGIFLYKVEQDAWIEVTEKGTRAAAVTRSMHYSVGCSAAPRRQVVPFHADHPFLFLIVHNASQSLLFGGWLSDPSRVSAD